MTPAFLIALLPLAAAVTTTTAGVNCRSGPSTSFDSLQQYQNGTSEFEVVCQTVGQDIFGSSLWDKTSDGCFVSDYYVTGNVTTRECDDNEVPPANATGSSGSANAAGPANATGSSIRSISSLSGAGPTPPSPTPNSPTPNSPTPLSPTTPMSATTSGGMNVASGSTTGIESSVAASGASASAIPSGSGAMSRTFNRLDVLVGGVVMGVVAGVTTLVV